MNWDIKHCQNNPSVIAWVHIDVSPWETEFLECLLKLCRHLDHQLIIEIGHLLAIIYSWWRPGLMKICNAIDPSRYLFWFLVGRLYCVHCYWGSSHDILALDILELENCFILTVECWFIKLSNTQVLFGSIWLGHFEASIHFSNSRHIVGNEWLQFSIEVQFLWLVPLNVLEKIFDILRHSEVGVLSWVVGAGNFLIIFAFFIVLGPWLCMRKRLLLRALRNCLSLILLLILSASAYIVHVDFIIFFI